MGTLAEQEPEVYQVVLDLQDPQANREREALMVAKVTQETQECLVIKVSHCKYTMCLIAILSQELLLNVFDNY